MSTWMVWGPTYQYGESILGLDPGEPHCDVVEVEAPTRSKAKAEALKRFRNGDQYDGCYRGGPDWWQDGNPFRYMKVDNLDKYPVER